MESETTVEKGIGSYSADGYGRMPLSFMVVCSICPRKGIVLAVRPIRIEGRAITNADIAGRKAVGTVVTAAVTAIVMHVIFVTLETAKVRSLQVIKESRRKVAYGPVMGSLA